MGSSRGRCWRDGQVGNANGGGGRTLLWGCGQGCVLQVKSIMGDVQDTAGQHGRAVTAYRQALDVLRALGQDEGSVAASIQRRLVAALLASGAVEEALAVVTEMLPYARNVHITEHSTAMHCLEGVVDALACRGDTAKAVPAAEALLQVRRLGGPPASSHPHELLHVPGSPRSRRVSTEQVAAVACRPSRGARGRVSPPLGAAEC